jgi:hypothetical protein
MRCKPTKPQDIIGEHSTYATTFESPEHKRHAVVCDAERRTAEDCRRLAAWLLRAAKWKWMEEQK